MYTVNLDDDNLGKEFSKACKILGFKQKVIIAEYMKHIIDRAEKVEALKILIFKSLLMFIKIQIELRF